MNTPNVPMPSMVRTRARLRPVALLFAAARCAALAAESGPSAAALELTVAGRAHRRDHIARAP